MNSDASDLEQLDFWTASNEASVCEFSKNPSTPEMQSSSINHMHMLEERVRAHINKGELSDAISLCEEAMGKARARLEAEDSEVHRIELVYALEVSADLCREEGNHSDGLNLYIEALDLIKPVADQAECQARLYTSVAVLQDYLEMPVEAIRHYQLAIAQFESLNPPADLDIIDLSNNAAFLLKLEGHLDEAEALYLKALNISHQSLGQHHEQTATLSNNLGALYLQTGHHQRAREMHLVALEGRRMSLGETHPETAQSHANLAIAFSDGGDRTSANQHYQKAIGIYELSAADLAEDLAVVRENYEIFNSSDD